jgi:hypothetical protein
MSVVAGEALRRWCWRLSLLVALVALVATLAFCVGTIQRPWNTVEGEVLFEAARFRAGLPVYVDPIRGAFDYGPVPARYYVLYPPVLSWLVSHVPAGAASLVLRLSDTVAWFGLLAWIASRATPACRRAAWIGALVIGGVYTLALFASSGRPDAVALLLVGLALTRSAHKGRVDAVAAALFALAPWVKPNVIGLATGAMLVELGLRRLRALVPISAAVCVTLAMAWTLQRVSHGEWLQHLLRSTAQPLTLAEWLGQAPSRLQFFGLPLAFVAFCAWRSRGDDGVKIALGGLATSLAWAALSLGKIGSASNYLMEPCLAALVLLTRAPVPPIADPLETKLAVVALLQALWLGVASVRSSYEMLFLEVPAQERALDRARAVCEAREGDVILGDETGIELALDGRITATPFQMTHLALRGLYPTDIWIADVRRPEVVGIVMEDDLLERPLSAVSPERDRFGPELRRVLLERFTLAEQNGEWRTYCRPKAAGR